MRPIGLAVGCLVAALAMTPACTGEPGRDTTVSVQGNTPSDGVLVGTFEIQVDLSDSGQPEVSVRPILDTSAGPSEPGVRRQAVTSIVSDLSFYGRGTWDPATLRVSVPLRLTNLGSNDFDEPRMQILWINPSDQGITFEQIHSGSGAAGSEYAYADIEAPPDGANNASAKQNVVIYDPAVVSFSFAVDVLAEIAAPSGEIFSDADDDRFNVEVGEDAGDDCDDNDPAVFPGGGGCLCQEGCDQTCSAGSCCQEICTSNCDVSCTDPGCDCYVEAGDNGSVEADCEPDTTCQIVSDGGKDVDVGTCESATCEVSCAETHDCEVTSCTDSSDCNVDCADGHDCLVVECQDSSSCVVECTDGHDCWIDDCRAGSQCAVTCANSHACEVNSCNSGSTCSLDCTNMIAKCDLGECKGGSTCSLTCDGAVECSLDPCEESTCSVQCSNTHKCLLTCTMGSTCQLTCGENVDVCNLSCNDGLYLKECPGGVWLCGSDPDPACP